MAKETFVRQPNGTTKLLEEQCTTLCNNAQAAMTTIEQTVSAAIQSSDTLLSVTQVLSQLAA